MSQSLEMVNCERLYLFYLLVVGKKSGLYFLLRILCILL